MKGTFAKSLINGKKLPLFRILIAQSSITIFASVFALTVNKIAAISALLAGTSCILPTLYVILASTRPVVAGGTGLAQAVRGEAGKILFIVALLSGIFTLVKPLNVTVFFGTFILMQICQLAAIWTETSRNMKNRYAKL